MPPNLIGAIILQFISLARWIVEHEGVRENELAAALQTERGPQNVCLKVKLLAHNLVLKLDFIRASREG